MTTAVLTVRHKHLLVKNHYYIESISIRLLKQNPGLIRMLGGWNDFMQDMYLAAALATVRFDDTRGDEVYDLYLQRIATARLQTTFILRL